MDDFDNLVYGEQVADLLPALRALRDGMERQADGSYHGRMRLEHSVAAPFLRALMRAEAELMLEDAEAIGPTFASERTYEQRAADALLRVAQALAA